MKSIVACIFALFTFMTLNGAELPEQEGQLISHRLKMSFSIDELKDLWKSKQIPKFIAPLNYGIDIYEVVYVAPWVDGTMIQASGLYFLPQMKPGEQLPVAVYHHGTQLTRDRMPILQDAQKGVSIGLAADGFITLMPDYYGIGKSDVRHLYQHAWSEAMSTIYMLYAIDELNEILGVDRKADIYLTGYSQGGHATMAAHKYLEKLAHPDYKVVASSPLSGAYDMSGAQSKVMFETYTQPFYLPYLLVTYQDAYGYFSGDIYEVFKPPYDTLIPKYMDGSKGYSAFNKVLPDVPADMLKDEYIHEFKTNPDFPILQRIEENNIYEWVPEAPVNFCYCSNDEEVAGENSVVAYNWMKENGANDVRLNNLSDVFYHNDCALFAIVETNFFFNNIRKGKLKRRKGPPFKRWLVKIYKRRTEKKILKERNEQVHQTESLRAKTQE